MIGPGKDHLVERARHHGLVLPVYSSSSVSQVFWKSTWVSGLNPPFGKRIRGEGVLEQSHRKDEHVRLSGTVPRTAEG